MRLIPGTVLACLIAAALWGVVASWRNNAAAMHGTGFDFYVMSLSWSPSYCEAEGSNANRTQCGADRDFAFIAHGLWPQFDSGYPEYCASAEPERVPNHLVDAVIDIMPSASLIGHQWRKHGSCTGLSQAGYFEATREAFERIAIPPEFAEADEARRISAEDAEEAFISANPGLAAGGIAVGCKAGRLAEIRICLTKDLSFRNCAEVDARGCRTSDLAVPQTP